MSSARLRWDPGGRQLRCVSSLDNDGAQLDNGIQSKPVHAARGLDSATTRALCIAEDWAHVGETEEPGPPVPVSVQGETEPSPHKHFDIQSNAGDGSCAKPAKLLAGLANSAPPHIPMSWHAALLGLTPNLCRQKGTLAKRYLGLACQECQAFPLALSVCRAKTWQLGSGISTSKANRPPRNITFSILESESALLLNLPRSNI
ncbi:hypothetical protein PWT90_09931 [Aphanocladium album]|nr:hypothetical protein PWT90_09931 [Aphanocladium album]